MSKPKSFFGYFTERDQGSPTYDPGMDTECLFCMKKLSSPVTTISLMKDADSRSYFYRTHKECYENMPSEDITNYESSLIDNITTSTNK